MDPVRNLCAVIVSTGYNSVATDITLLTGEGAKLPDPATEGAFNLGWFNLTDYPYFGFNAAGARDPFYDFSRVIAKAGDIITVTRNQEGIASQNHNIAGKNYCMVLAFTKKSHDDIEYGQWVDVRRFGAALDGVTDDTVAFQAAIDFLGAEGGTVRYSGKALIDLDLVLNKYVTLMGTIRPDIELASEIPNMQGIRLNSARKIYCEQGAGIKNSLIYRKGMTFPAADAALFAGTAVEVTGQGVFVKDSLMIGFDKLVHNDGYMRLDLQNLKGDAINGIEINNSYDIARIENVHIWDFATYGHPTPDHKRSGTAFKFTGVGDWTKVVNCFAFAHLNGFWVNGCNSMTFISCGADGDSGDILANSVGFRQEGASTLMTYLACQAAACDHSGLFLGGTGNHTQVIDFMGWVITQYGIAIAGSGNVTIRDGYLNSVATGILINHADPTVLINGVRFNTIGIVPISIAIPNPKVMIGDDNDFGAFSGNCVSGSTLQEVPSAATLILPHQGKRFRVTGTTNMFNIQASWAEREITLVFADALTITDGGNLKMNGNFVTSADDTIKFACDGTNWQEVSRSPN
jgi:hypothetical protein